MTRHRGSRRAAWCIAALLSLSAGLARAEPSADQAAAAEALFREGRELVAQGKLAEACPKFAASQRLDPGYGTQWNLADCLERLGRTASAWAAFREAADMASRAGQADREAKATRRAADLEARLERLAVAVSAPADGLVVRRNGAVLDAGAWGAPLPVDPGKHRIEATAPGKKPFSVEAQTAGPGKLVTVAIPPLEDDPAALGASAAAPPQPGGPPAAGRSGAAGAGAGGDDGGASTRRTLAFVAGGVGVAGVVTGSIFGLIAGARWNRAQDEHCRTETLCDDRGVSLVDDAKRAATLSNIGFVVGGVGLAAGVALFVTSLGDAQPAAARIVVTPAVGANGGGLGIHGRF
ncbi:MULTISPECIES: hypothetical protein [Sorangium]|uniref:PEGA domain-containing protein n=1 Tax=Sorangium cellulosum TaxID=56 RepID=A0A4P2QYW6_SORCE|nr:MULTISPECIES: hypothetical protein [Sorangium]AUX35411.1 hypothetical protein SOCE836_076030 [Sorangium cellulosum]WCQ94715.1 hypothetical protein NQZ70_07483 [Sorangium sp. Soce836]